MLSEAKGAVDLLSRGWDWFQDRRDPVRAQAKRLIDAFDTYGIAKQQIARVLPPALVHAARSNVRAEQAQGQDVTRTAWLARFGTRRTMNSVLLGLALQTDSQPVGRSKLATRC